MLTQKQQNLLYDAGVIADCFGQKLSVGDYVLCKSYGSPVHDQVSQITKVNRKTIQLTVQKRKYTYGNYVPKPRNHYGKWNYYPNFSVSCTEEKMNRNPFSVIKISPELKAQLDATTTALINSYPELFI